MRPRTIYSVRLDRRLVDQLQYITVNISGDPGKYVNVDIVALVKNRIFPN